MKTFSTDCDDEEIRQAVVAWSEMLAREDYVNALGLFLHTTGPPELVWTPERLEDWVSNYGCSRADYDSGKFRKITSLLEQPASARFIAESIEVNRDSLYGLDPEHYVGMVHYDHVPLDGSPSDLTARFSIKRIGPDEITVEFRDIHVM